MAKNRYHLIKRGQFLVPADDEAREKLQTFKEGELVGADVVRDRNYKRLQRAHCLVRYAFELWEPRSMITSIERQTVKRMCQMMVDDGLPLHTARAFGKEYLARLERQRQTVEADKSIDEFRAFVTIEAGHYDTVATPAGPKRIPKSWSYRTGEDDFTALYTDLKGACWRLVFAQQFSSDAELENVINGMLEQMK